MFSPSHRAMLADAEEQDRLTICRDAELGLCVRALRAFEAGDVLDVFTGELTSAIVQHSLQVSDGVHIAGTQFIGFLSHGCDPNCRLDMARSELVALRPIAAKELLTIDYAATEDRLYSQFACICGAANCRQWVSGRREPVNQAGRMHLDGLSLQPAD